MTIRCESRDPRSIAAEWLAVGVVEGATESPRSLAGTSAKAVVRSVLDAGDFAGKLGETLPIYGPSGIAARNLILFGLGPDDRADGSVFPAGVAVTKKLGGRPRASLAVALPGEGVDPSFVSSLVEGLVVGTRGPDLRKAEPSRHAVADLLMIRDASGALATEEFEAAVRRGEIVGEAVNLARELGNTPPADKPPVRFAARAGELCAQVGLEAVVRDESWLRDERFGGVLGVAAGSDQPPAFVEISYRKGGDGPTLALVGKGVTFDSGGLSLKPSASMEDMKADMTGAAVVLATILAVAKLGLKVNLTASFALVENMTGGRALKLGDVLTHRNGKTVEVMNTDAEGRLVLADVLSYVAERKPERIVDLATLTGACVVALGTKVAGLFSNRDDLAEQLQAAGRSTGERAWRLPLDDDYREGLKSPIADMKNIGGKWGGAITAAKFLESFVAEVPWLHLDIAGPSWADADSATRDAGATGCFVRTLVRWIEATAAGR